MPVTAVASFAHRVSGALLFLSTPFLIYALARSLRGPESFAAIRYWLSGPLGGFVLFVLWWALLHHLFAGVRFLLMDLDIGIDLNAGRASAWLVNVAALIVALLTAGALLL